jgi:hypothetical protein
MRPDARQGYFRAKVAQEKLIETSGIPYTIIRSTQFLEFLGGIAASSADGNLLSAAGRVRFQIDRAIAERRHHRLPGNSAAARRVRSHGLAFDGMSALRVLFYAVQQLEPWLHRGF